LLYLLSKLAPVNGLARKISMNEDIRFFKDQRLLFVKLQLTDEFLLQQLLETFKDHRYLCLLVHDIVGVRKGLVVCHEFREVNTDTFEELGVIGTDFAVDYQHVVVPDLQPTRRTRGPVVLKRHILDVLVLPQSQNDPESVGLEFTESLHVVDPT
jgi:hypothetical protein